MDGLRRRVSPRDARRATWLGSASGKGTWFRVLGLGILLGTLSCDQAQRANEANAAESAARSASAQGDGAKQREAGAKPGLEGATVQRDRRERAAENSRPEKQQLAKQTPSPKRPRSFSVTRRELREASGIARSLANPGWYWLHNDSGSGPYLLALDPERRLRFRLRVSRSKSLDWEDLAIAKDRTGKSWLFIGDTGRNLANKKAEASRVWVLPEPVFGRDIVAPPPTPRRKKLPSIRSAPAFEWQLVFPKKRPPDVEAIFAYGGTHLAFVSKERDGKSNVFTLELPKRFADAKLRLEARARLKLADAENVRARLATAADLLPDGRLAVLTYTRIAIFDWPSVLMPGAPREPRLKPALTIPLPPLVHAEALASTGDGAVLVFSEGRPAEAVFVDIPKHAARRGPR